LPNRYFYDHELVQPVMVHPKAVAACQVCPVFDECREHSLRREGFGYWAGLTAGQRRAERKRLSIKLEVMDGVSIFNGSDELLVGAPSR
jgi:hypothetical protein